MDVAVTVLTQVGIMFFLITIGYFCYKGKLISDSTASQLSEILLLIVTPAIIVKAFLIEYEPSLIKGIMFSALLSVVTQVVAIIISIIFIRKNNDKGRCAVERFAVVYGNAGFMGIPLIASALPDNGVLYASIFVAVFNVFMWTHGITIMSGHLNKDDAFKILKSPPIISVIVGLVLFLTSISLPNIITSTIDFVADLNTPLAMLVIGVYIAKIDLKSLFTDLSVYKVSFIRLMIVPLAMIIIFMFISPVGQMQTVITSTTISSACPTAASTVLVATRYNLDTEHASKIIALSTLLSIFTIPLITLILHTTMGMFA